MYLGAASGTTVSHVSDIVGPVSLTHFYITQFFLLNPEIFAYHTFFQCI